MEALLLIFILGISLLAIYWSTRNKSILILSAISFGLLLLFNFLGIFFINLLFSIHITEIFRIVPVISSILLVSNLGILVGFYLSKKGSKGFRISSIRKEYLSDSIKQTIFLILLGSSTLLFLSPQTEAIVSISILSTVSTIWLTYLASRYLLK